MSKLELR